MIATTATTADTANLFFISTSVIALATWWPGIPRAESNIGMGRQRADALFSEEKMSFPP